jgi:hypothetical protein
MTNVCQSSLVKKDLLDDEDGDSFGEFGARFHDAETEGNDFGREEEVDDGVVVILLESHRQILAI